MPALFRSRFRSSGLLLLFTFFICYIAVSMTSHDLPITPHAHNQRVCRMGTGALSAPPSNTVREAWHKYTWWLPHTGSSSMATGPSLYTMRPSCEHIIDPYRTCSTPHLCLAAPPSVGDSGSRSPPPPRAVGFPPRRWQRLRIGTYHRPHAPRTRTTLRSYGSSPI